MGLTAIVDADENSDSGQAPENLVPEPVSERNAANANLENSKTDDKLAAKPIPVASTGDNSTPTPPRMVDLDAKEADLKETRQREDEEARLREEGKKQGMPATAIDALLIAGMAAVGIGAKKQAAEKAAIQSMKDTVAAMNADPALLARKLNKDAVTADYFTTLHNAQQLKESASNFSKTANFAKLRGKMVSMNLTWASAMSSPEFRGFMAELSDPKSAEGKAFKDAHLDVTAKAAALETSWSQFSKTAETHNFDISEHNQQIMGAANRSALETVPMDSENGKNPFNNFAEKLDDLGAKASEVMEKLSAALGKLFQR